ncbi:hypothetical protein EDF62_3268 [Leucobacter luti]|uniref:HNH endonuclease n=1 Tax=Leucobacter luti TaxID=340320 RepID=A0A4R6RT93_9MICO|nr:hypothetical protein EDF62_3268 [Leucobacter luti]
MLMDLAHSVPTWALASIAVALLILVVRALPKTARKDPKRAFDSAQRNVGFTRAGHQCEFSTPWFTRCTRTAQHADHWFPHTRGGATSMQNLVAACAPHNLSKGGRQPSALAGFLIAARRRKYFPETLDRKAGEWF